MEYNKAIRSPILPHLTLDLSISSSTEAPSASGDGTYYQPDSSFFSQNARQYSKELHIDITSDEEMEDEGTTCCECKQGFYKNNKACILCEAKEEENKTQEDKYLIMQEFMGNNKQAVFGIFDGHSGARAADYCKSSLYTKLQANFEDLKINTANTIEKVLKETDEEFLEIAREYKYTDGSTCVLGLIMNNKLTLANIGDSTALLVRNSNVIELTSEHNYSRCDEYKRIVDQNCPDYHIFEVGLCYRINGQLAVSRSIGDLKYKPVVISDPEIQTINLSSLDQYLILASDGIFTKKFNKKNVIEYIIESVKSGKAKTEIANGLIQTAIDQGSNDNATAVVVDLKELYQRWSETPFSQVTVNNECECTQDENCFVCYSKSFTSNVLINANCNKSTRSQKLKNKNEDIDMEVDCNDCSPFSRSTNVSSCVQDKNRNSDWMLSNCTQFDQKFEIPLSIGHSTSKKSKSNSEHKTNSNPYFLPEKEAVDIENNLESIRKITRNQTLSKKSKDKISFKF